MSSIEIFNPREKPYGQLSNNAKHNMTINKELWNSVTQFIYSNMINNYVYKDRIKKSNIKKIYSEYVKYRKKVSEDIISSSLEEALQVKFENPDLLKILLSTGDSDILYVSPNSFLGIGYDQKGSNILGKYLVQLRNNILNTKIKTEELEEEQNNLYKAYIMYTILKKEMINNGNDLSDYLYLNQGPKKIFTFHLVSKLDDIVNIYLQNNPDFVSVYERLLIDKANRNLFLDLYERKDPEIYPLLKYSLTNPSVIIFDLRKKYLENVRNNQEIIKYDNVFNMYLEYTLETKYPEIKKGDYETILNKEFKKQQFVEDPQYIIELDIIKEKKSELEVKKAKLQNLYIEAEKPNMVKRYKNLENTLNQYKKELKKIDKNNSKDIESKKKDIEYIEKSMQNIKNKISLSDIQEEEENKEDDNYKKENLKNADLIIEKKNKIKEKKDELDILRIKYNEEVKEKDKLNDKKRELENRLSKTRILKYDNNEKKAIKEKQKIDIEKKINDIDKEIENFKNKIYSSTNIENQKKIKELATIISNIKISKTDTQEQKVQKQVQIDELKVQIDDLKKYIESMTSKKIKELEDQIKDEEEEINNLQLIINNAYKRDIYTKNIFNINKIEKDIKEDEKLIEMLEKKLSNYKMVLINVNYNELKKRLFTIKNKLPSILLQRIDEFLSNFKIPTEEEVLFSKTFNLDSYNMRFDLDSNPFGNVNIPKKQIKIYEGNPSADYISDLQLIKNNSYQLLSPVYYTGMLRIKNFDYPTVTHYIIANLFANMPIIKKDIDERLAELEDLSLKISDYTYNLKSKEKLDSEKIKELENLKKIYKNKKESLNKIYEKDTQNVITYGGNLKEVQQYILKDPSGNNWNRNTPYNWIDYKTLYEKYINISEMKEDERLKELAIIGINKKFEDRILQNLLISTENKNIVYTDTKDYVLGIGKNDTGENFVGNYLTKLRSEIFIQQNLENIDILTEENVTNIIKGDSFMNNWFEMKVKDMCSIVKKVREYSKIKYDINVENNELFFKIVLNKIFQPCSEFSILSKKVTAETPLYFVKIVNKYIKKYTPSIIDLLWKRIVVMVYYIIKNVKEPTLYNIKNILLKVETLVSQEQNCILIIKEDEEQNCIFSAIINIIKGIFQYNTEYNKYKNNLVSTGFYFYDENGKKRKEEAKSITTLINKYDVELATSIILNSKNIIHLENKIYINIENMAEYMEKDNEMEEEEPPEMKETEYREEGEEEDEDDNLDDDISERESYIASEDEEYGREDEEYGREDDYGDCDGAGGDGKYEDIKNNLEEQEQMSAYYKTLLTEYINNNSIFDKKNDINLISKYIVDASMLIKNYKRIPEKIKKNRINFFATIR